MQKIHRKVLDKGIPPDVMPGIKGVKVCFCILYIQFWHIIKLYVKLEKFNKTFLYLLLLKKYNYNKFKNNFHYNYTKDILWNLLILESIFY